MIMFSILNKVESEGIVLFTDYNKKEILDIEGAVEELNKYIEEKQ